MGKLDTMNQLLGEIERQFHLTQNVIGAELVYTLRERISRLRGEIHDMKIRLTRLEKNAPSFEGGGGQRETGKTRPVLPSDDPL